MAMLKIILFAQTIPATLAEKPKKKGENQAAEIPPPGCFLAFNKYI